MKFTTLLTGFVAVMAFSSAQAADVSWDGGGDGTNWNSANNWSNDQVPTQADRVTIGSAYTDVHVNVSTATAGLIVIQGVLKIDANARLLIDGQASVGTAGDNQVSGTIVLQGANAQLRFDDRDQTLSGSGSIKGEVASASIRIEDTFKLTSYMLIHGMLKIMPLGAGTATFDNAQLSSIVGGTVRANAAGTLEFDNDLILNASKYEPTPGTIYRPRFEAVTDGSALLKFSREADGNPDLVLEADFQVADCADMQFAQSVTTNGCLNHGSGTVIVDSGKVFTFCDSSYNSAGSPWGTCP